MKELNGIKYAWCGQETCAPSTNRGTICEYHYHENLSKQSSEQLNEGDTDGN